MAHPKARRSTDSGTRTEAIAFGDLFDRHAQAVYAFCARRTADLALAEDLTSITFLEAWRHRERMPTASDGEALPWLIGVAHNVVRNARRGHRRYRAALARMPAPPVMAPAEEQVVARAATEAALQAALNAISRLPRREQDVVMLVLWSGLTYEETAAALSLPLGTVQSRISRARARLRIALSDTQHLVLKEST